MHQATLSVIVIDGVVHGAAIVPEGERARPPSEAAGEFRPRRVGVEEIEDRRALLAGHAVEASGIDRVDEQCLAAGLGMNADRRMAALDIGLWIVAADRDRAAGAPILGNAGDAVNAAGMQGGGAVGGR